MSDSDLERCALAALLAALGIRAAGHALSRESLRQAVQALGIASPDPWVLECILRLVEMGPIPAATARQEPQAPSAYSPAAGADGARSRAPGAGEDEPGRALVTPGPSAGRDDPKRTSEGASALYLYAVGRGRAPEGFGGGGVDDRPVEVVTADGWFAVVHRCPPRPYVSDDREQVVRWVQQHHAVLERAAEAFGDIIPVGFDTLIFKEGRDPLGLLREWISEREPQLEEVLDRIAGCREYGVQLLQRPELARSDLLASDPELQELHRRIRAAPQAAAYLLQQDLDQQVRRALAEQGTRRAESLLAALRSHCRDVRAERLRDPGDGTEMVANFSCLVAQGEVERFLEALAPFNAWNGYTIRVTGPWPPYSFANLQPGGGEGH